MFVWIRVRVGLRVDLRTRSARRDLTVSRLLAVGVENERRARSARRH